VKRLFLASLLLASCGQSGTPNVQIKDAWARETVAGQTSTAAYFTVDNVGNADDRLTGITIAAPASATLHATESSGGISRMREMSSGLAVPAGSTISLKPGATHVMIMGLNRPLKAGNKLQLGLRFEKSGEKPIDVPIAPASGPEGH
jgi:copper(I)-binding protein